MGGWSSQNERWSFRLSDSFVRSKVVLTIFNDLDVGASVAAVSQ